MIYFQVIEKLSVSRASGEAKLQVMKDIAAEHDVHWDPAPFEKEIRTVPNDLLVSACCTEYFCNYSAMTLQVLQLVVFVRWICQPLYNAKFNIVCIGFLLMGNTHWICRMGPLRS